MNTRMIRGSLPFAGLLLCVLLIPSLHLPAWNQARQSHASSVGPCDSVRIEELLRASESLRRRNYHRAAETGLEALVLAERCGSERQQAAAHAAIGWAQRKRLPTDSVRVHFQLALDGARRAGDRRLVISALQGLAMLQHYDGRNHLAAALVDTACTLAEKERDSTIIASLLVTRGLIENGRRHREIALVHFDRALAIYRSEADSIGMLNALIHSVTSSITLGRGAADSICQLVYERVRLRDDSVMILDAVCALGWVVGSKGQRDSAASLFRQAFELSERIGDARIMAQSISNLGLNRSRSDLPRVARPLLLRASDLARELRDSSLLQTVFATLAKNYEMTGDEDTATLYHEWRLGILRARNDSTWLDEAYSRLSLVLEQRGLHDSARIVMREAVRCARARGSLNALLIILFTQGAQEYRYGFYRASLQRYQECARLLETAPPTHFNHNTYHYRLAETYTGMKQWSEAIDHYSRAYRGFLARKNFHPAATTQVALAETFSLRAKEKGTHSDLDTAMSILHSVLEQTPTFKDQYLHITCHRILGTVLTQLGKPDSALVHLTLGLDRIRQFQAWQDEPPFLHAIGLTHHRAGRYEESISMMRSAVEGYRKLGYPRLLRDLYEDLASIAMERGQHRRALKYQREYTALNDSIMRAEHMVLLADADARYENAEKRQELALLENKQRLSKLEIERQREEILRQRAEAEGNRQRLHLLAQERELDRLRIENHEKQIRFSKMKDSMLVHANAGLRHERSLQSQVIERRTQLSQALFAVLALLLLSGFLIFRRIKGRQRESLLRAQAAEFQKESAVLAARAAELQAQAAEAETLRIAAETERREKEHQRSMTRNLFETQEKERKRIAADLHDSLGQELVVIKNRAMLATEQLDNPDALRSQLDRVIDMSAKAMSTVREITHNLRPTELDRLGLTAALHSIVQDSQESSAVHITAEIEAIDNIYTPEQDILIYRIVQEGLCNIVRHAEAQEATLRVGVEDEAISISIRDDGRGIPPTSTTESAVGVRHGLGLHSMQERTEMLGGRFELQTAPGQGTSLHIVIPVTLENVPEPAGETI